MESIVADDAEVRVANLEGRFVAVERDVARQDRRIDEISDRMGAIERTLVQEIRQSNHATADKLQEVLTAMRAGDERLGERLTAVHAEVHDWKTRAGLLKWVGGGVVGCVAFITGEVRSWWDFFGGS